ncbi:MAG: hypothetical protein U5L04_00630 [Trueperaceae bacterium]|nr:hypothetical protein [Trueperaceae bacterium]
MDIRDRFSHLGTRAPRAVYVAVCVAVGTALLAACGTTTLPAQQQSDLFALRGERVTISEGSSLDTATLIRGTLTTTFNDGQPPQLRPRQFQITLGFDADVGFGSALGEPPCGIEITRLDIIITASDQAGERSVTLPPLTLNERLVLEPNGSDYRILTEDARVGADIRDAALLGQLIDIVTSGGSNTATVTVIANTQSVPELPSGVALTLTLRSATGVFGF